MFEIQVCRVLGKSGPDSDRLRVSGAAIECQECKQLGVGSAVEWAIQRFGSPQWFRIPVRLARLTDEALVLHARNGCLDAMGLLFDRYYAFVSDIALKMLRNVDEAQAVVEEVFYEVFLKAREFDCTKARVRQWVARSAYVRCMSRRRLPSVAGQADSRGIDQLWEMKEPATELGRKLAALPEKEQTRLFRKARKRLSEKQRRVLEFSIFDFLTSDEIAVRIGATRDEVRSLLYEALLVMHEECQNALH